MTLKISIAQLNPVLGDMDGNVQKIKHARDNVPPDTDLIVYTELVITGYPPEDLVLKPAFIRKTRQYVEDLAKTTMIGPALLISAPWDIDGKIYNAAILLSEGDITHVIPKHERPNYGVFDEVRIFEMGDLPDPVILKNHKLGIMTCEDMWKPSVAKNLKAMDAELLIVLNGSPYEINKHLTRVEVARERIKETGLPLLYTNQVGGQDELVFDGGSFILDNKGNIVASTPSHTEASLDLTWTGDAFETDALPAPDFGKLESVYHTLVLGVRDYVQKNGFPGVVIGLSGGVDSAITAAIAVDAIGAENVRTIMMPSPYTSTESLEDAKACAKALGISYKIVPIDPAMHAYDTMLGKIDVPNDGITAENIQSRARGMLLMAISNATGDMVLSTGNKSEMSVGYATLYGDMNGGYNPLKDVYKTLVFDLCKWRNSKVPKYGLGPDGEVIPNRIITKPPSAELRPDQKDEDSLPPYEVLDDILNCLIEHEMSVERITTERGHSAEIVNRIWKLLDRAEYKRRQACPGVKITPKAFGRDRRYPITNKFIDIT
jgi:NAD+ synthase